jgi:hypothetical protein
VIREFNPKVIGSPDHSASSGARLNTSDAQLELIWDCSHPHASNSCAIIRKVAYDTRALEMSVYVVDRRGGIPFDPKIPSPTSSHSRLVRLVIPFALHA